MKKVPRQLLVCATALLLAFAGASFLGEQQETSCPPQQPGSFCVFRGHTDSVSSVAFSPDGKGLASGSSDRTVRLWDIAAHALIRTLPEHAGPVVSVAFSPDGKWLASSFRSDLVKLWEVSTGREIHSLLFYSNVGAIAFSRDGRLMAAGGCGKLDFSRLPPDQCVQGEIRLWNPHTGALMRIISGHRNLVRSLAFSPNGQWLASGAEDGAVKLWEVATGREVLRFQHGERVASVAFSPDGQMLASGAYVFGVSKGTVKLWEVTLGREVRTITFSDWVHDVAFRPDGRFLAVSARDIHLWDTATWKEVRTLSLGRQIAFAIAFSPDGQLLASAEGGYYRDIRIWYVGDLGTTELE